ncbi:MAG: aminotransferase class V-fold PLP-dependent enzyme [Planctomycetota bacterium]|jgi:cysteine desulfurase family protein
MATRTINFDNAATAGRRPDAVGEAMLRALTEVPANPGRSGHAVALEAARIVEDARVEVAGLVGARDPAHVAFTKNATEALNVVLAGRVREGDLVLASSWEHNATMRPLRWLERERGVRVEPMPPAEDGPVDVKWLASRLASERVALVAMLAASNVTGEVMPVAEAGALCREHETFLLVDAAQGAGTLQLDVERDRIDALALTGHKDLYGLPGTGALWLREPETVQPLLRGGTGSRSDEEEHPDFAPDRFEGGTPNVPGLAGLAAGVRFVRERGQEALLAHARGLADRLTGHLADIRGVRLFGPDDPERKVGIVSFTVEGRSTSDVARELGGRGVLSRPGLHCAPRAHRTLGTFPGGTVRLSLSAFNTAEEIDAAAETLREIAG